MVGQCRNGGCLAQHEFLTSHWRHQMGTPATPKQRRTSDRAISFRLACLIMKPSARLTGHCSPFTRVETFYCLVPNSLTAFTCGSRLCCNCYAMSRVDCGGPQVYLVHCDSTRLLSLARARSAYWFIRLLIVAHEFVGE